MINLAKLGVRFNKVRFGGPTLLVTMALSGVTPVLAEEPPASRERLMSDAQFDAETVNKLAATLAAALANTEAKKRFNVAPFLPASAKAVFRGGSWEWQAIVGYGKGDLQAKVSFGPDGSHPTVEIAPLTNEVRRNF